MLAEMHGDDWDDQLKAEWTAALDEGVRMMAEGYNEEPFGEDPLGGAGK